jgi:hypothetical protein
MFMYLWGNFIGILIQVFVLFFFFQFFWQKGNMVFLTFSVFSRKVGQDVDAFQNAGYTGKYIVNCTGHFEVVVSNGINYSAVSCNLCFLYL